ncbi:MAG: PRC-barrel domain-containing protein [Candidatus Buchananbacteria bacterium]|nr:PRC-barrel domain-containing protein [Candidatus Buchananbacteria bacterium]
MELDGKKIIGLPTETRSGQYLGKVKSIDFDQTTGKVTYIYVRPVWTKRFFCRQFIIHRDQVVSLQENKLVVDDTSIKTPVTSFQKSNLAPSK